MMILTTPDDFLGTVELLYEHEAHELMWKDQR